MICLVFVLFHFLYLLLVIGFFLPSTVRWHFQVKIFPLMRPGIFPILDFRDGFLETHYDNDHLSAQMHIIIVLTLLAEVRTKEKDKANK